MNVGLYARVSTERQQERGTVTSQLEALRAAAEAEGHEIVEEFVDDGYSGARLDRPALDRLRDAAQAGVLDGVLCLCADRLARAYAYQVLILEELERFNVTVQFLQGPALGEDPQATLLVQMQGVIAEYENAKIAERYRRGKLHRARAGEIPFWKMSYGHRRVVPDDGGSRPDRDLRARGARSCAIFSAAYVEGERSIRQIALDLHDRRIPSPTGKPMWGTSTIGRLLHQRGVHRHRLLQPPRVRSRPQSRAAAHGTARLATAIVRARSGSLSRCHRSSIATRSSAPNMSAAITRSGTHAAPNRGAWLLRGLIECGHCHVGCNCHKMRGRNGTIHRYYYCRNHDLLRAGGEDRRCPERNIRANELDEYVFQQVRQALLDPRALLAGERAVIAGTPLDENELITAQLKRLYRPSKQPSTNAPDCSTPTKPDYFRLDNLTRRTATLTTRRDELPSEKDTLTTRSTELATENRLRRGLAGFAERVAASLDDLDHEARQRLLRLVVEKVRVTGWRVEIHLKIPLADDGPDEDHPPTRPQPRTPTVKRYGPAFPSCP